MKKSNEFKVVAYYPSWEENAFDNLRFDIITHVIYAFAIPTIEGELLELKNPDNASQLVKLAHENGAKALVAVGGWSYKEIPLEETFVQATNSSDKIEKLSNELIALCEKYGFDGIDVDWEHPRLATNTYKQYENLILSLSEKLHKNNKLLTSAVISGATADKNINYDAAAHTDKVLSAVDWLNIMAYDGGDGIDHSTYEFAVDCVKYWGTTRGLAKEKVVLGVPFYARPSWTTYKDILRIDEDACNKDIINLNGVSLYYNGIKTIKSKTAYAMENAGGIMIWEISQDTTDVDRSLLNAIGEEF